MKRKSKIKPIAAPVMIPAAMDIGIAESVLIILSPLPEATPKNSEKIVIAKTSSADDPASMIVGISFLFPFLLARKLSIEGTIIAGETAASMNPVKPQISQLNPKSSRQINIKDEPSRMQGTNDINKAVLPTFLMEALLIPRPALDSMTIRAKDLSDGERSQRICGVLSFRKIEQRIPNRTIPKTEGAFNLRNILEKSHPPKNITAKVKFKFSIFWFLRTVNVFSGNYC